MVLKDIEIHTDQTDLKDILGKSSFHLCDLFLRHLNNLKTRETKKIVVVLQKKGVDMFARKEREKAFVLLETIEYYKDIDHIKYEQGDINEKKEVIWGTLCDSLLTTADQLDWDKEQIKRAYNKGLDSRLENKWVYADKLATRDKKYFATVSVDFDFYSFKVFLTIKDSNDKMITQKKIIDRDPSWGWYSFPFLKFCKWTSNNEFSFGVNEDDPDKIIIRI